MLLAKRYNSHCPPSLPRDQVVAQCGGKENLARAVSNIDCHKAPKPVEGFLSFGGCQRENQSAQGNKHAFSYGVPRRTTLGWRESRTDVPAFRNFILPIEFIA